MCGPQSQVSSISKKTIKREISSVLKKRFQVAKMAAKNYSQETLEAFHNVRIGGPKEKRLRRVELMGEHSPKSIFYIKVTEEDGSDLVSIAALMDSFSG